MATPSKKADAGLTPKRDHFALLVAQGMTQADAYRGAFAAKKSTDKTIHEQAARLMADCKVAARVEEYRKQIADKAAESISYEYQDAMRECNEAIAFAQQCGSAAAMVSAIKLKVEINGLHVEQRKNNRDPLEGISPERAKAALEALQAIRKAKQSA